MPRIQQLLQFPIPNQPILHISFFDGIGAASQALKFLGAQIIFTMSWETNTDCQAILDQHHQPIQHGDITTLDRDTINLLIQPIVQDNPNIIILITTGPPYVDFSRLRHQPPGTELRAASSNDRSRSSSTYRQIGQTTWFSTSWRMSSHILTSRHSSRPLLGRPQRRRTDFTPTDVVAEHPMGGSSPHSPPIHPIADHTTIPEQHLAPPQPNCSPSPTTIPYQGLGDTSSPPRRTTISLPDDTSAHRPRQTTSQDRKC